MGGDERTVTRDFERRWSFSLFSFSIVRILRGVWRFRSPTFEFIFCRELESIYFTLLLLLLSTKVAIYNKPSGDGDISPLCDQPNFFISHRSRAFNHSLGHILGSQSTHTHN